MGTATEELRVFIIERWAWASVGAEEKTMEVVCAVTSEERAKAVVSELQEAEKQLHFTSRAEFTYTEVELR